MLLLPHEGITCLPLYLSTFLPTDQEDHLLAVNHLGIVALVFVVFVHSMLPERHLPVVTLWLFSPSINGERLVGWAVLTVSRLLYLYSLKEQGEKSKMNEVLHRICHIIG